MSATAATPAVAAPAVKAKTTQPAAPATTTATEVAPATTTSESVVTVVANRLSNQVDRQVYDVKSDPATSSNSAADALNNVPSVAVTPDGQVTLRGNSNVQILINGKPSAMLQGENRGAALNAIPASDIASVEVINTPGAQFGNQGGGGAVLNLVMQKNRRPGGFATMSANAGTNGRNANLNGTYNSGRIELQGSANVRRDRRESSYEAARTRIDPVTGIARRSNQSSASENATGGGSLGGGITYNLTDRDKVGGDVHLMRNDRRYTARDHYVNFGSDDIADSDYERAASGTTRFDNRTFSVRWDHEGDTRGEEFEMDLRISDAGSGSAYAYANSYLLRPPGVPDSRSTQFNTNDDRIADLSGDYKNPAVAGGTLKAGYKALRQRNSFDHRFFDVDPVTQAEKVNPVRTNSFGVGETVFALYGSYEWRFGERWGVLGGLRAEHTKLDVDQRTSGVHADKDYTHYIPSFYVTYEVSKDTDVRLSYANRIHRAGAFDLNPFVVHRDEFNATSGNPYLEPSETDSLELGLETKIGKVNTNLRAYYRHESNLIEERRYFINDTVLLTTRANGGTSDAGGVEFTLDGKVTPKLNLHVSGNLAHMEQTTPDGVVGGLTKRKATSLTGRARFQLQATKNDILQLMLSAQGKVLSGQGHRDPYSTADFTYRRVLTPALGLVLNVRDMFDSTRTRTITDTSLLKETSIRHSSGRSISLGLFYRVGGFPPPPARKPASPGAT